MNVLALDTSTTYLSLGWMTTSGTHFERNLLVERAHAERTLPELQAFLHDTGAAQADLIAVGSGPGSYTGVRVGVSLALGLAQGWGARVVGVPSLEAMAVQSDGLVAVTLDARKAQVYSAVYRVEAGRILETVIGIEKRLLSNFEAMIPAQTAWQRDTAPSGLGLARLGLERWSRGERGVEISYL